MSDPTGPHRAEQRAEQLMSVLQLSPSPILLMDDQGVIEYANPAYLRSSGYEEAELLGQPSPFVGPDREAQAGHQSIWQHIRAGHVWTGELKNRRKDGRLYREHTLIAPLQEDQADTPSYVVIKQDVTPLDPLTGLNTRAGFSLLIQDLMDRDGWQPSAIVISLDIVSLRDINAAYGYAAGDRLLVEFTQRLQSLADTAGMASRIGGDEFALFLVTDPANSTDAQLQRLLDTLSVPFEIDDVAIHVAVRLGFTALGAEARTAETLLREAETALFHHRAETTRPWMAYDEELAQASRMRIGLTRDLRMALQNAEFEVHFQPKVELATGRLISAEALLRWNHPTRGLIPPGVFIPVAEQSQLIAPIGDWALRRACQHLRAWRDQGLDLVRVAVNVSFVQFRSGQFPAFVQQVLEETGIEPEQLSLEITENVFVNASPMLLEQMQALRDMNVRLSLDDFGAGYSSLLYLAQYPFDEIKIDQAFVRQLMEDGFSRDVVKAVKMLAGALDADIIAEGIESADVRDALIALGIERGQGFYYSWPLEAEDFRWLLQRRGQSPVKTADTNSSTQS